MKNYYEILQVSQNASEEVIKSAYKALVKKHHPDIAGQNKSNNDEFIKDINEAYEVLMDAEKRLEHDMMLDMEKEEEILAAELQYEQNANSNYNNEYMQNEYNSYNNSYINNMNFETTFKLIILAVIAVIILAVVYLMPLFAKDKSENNKPSGNINVEASDKTEDNEQPEDPATEDETEISDEENEDEEQEEEEVIHNGYFQLDDSAKIVKAVMGKADFVQQYSDVAYWYYGSSMVTFDSERNVIGWDNKGNLKVNQGEKVKNSTFALGSSKSEVVKAMGTPEKVDGGAYLSNWYYGNSQIAFDGAGNVWGWDNKGNLEVNQGTKIKNSTFSKGSSQAEVVKAMGTPDKIQDILIFSYWYYGTSRITFDVDKNVSSWKQGNVDLKVD